MPLGFGLLKFLHKTSGAASIVSASPNYGSTGANRSIVITKTGGAAYTGSETVTIGSSCTITAHTTSTLTVTVPSGLTEGLHDVVVNSVTMSNGYLALAMTSWLDLGVTMSAGNLATAADQAGSTSVATTWTADVTHLPAYNAADATYGGHASVSLDKSQQQSIDAGNVLPFGTGANSATIVAAAACTNASGDTYAGLLSQSFSSLYFNLALDATATGKLQFYCTTGPAVSNAAINDGVARGIIAVHDQGASKNKMWIDGALQTTQGTDAGAFGATAEHLSAGCSENAGLGRAFFWDGSLAEVFTVQRALSAPEIAFLMAKSTVGSFANLNGVGA